MRTMRASPRFTARAAGLLYVIVFVTGILSLYFRNGVLGMIAGVFYIAVTVLFYLIFKPLSPSVSLLAAVVSLLGIVIGPLSMLMKPLAMINPLVCFGIYCSLIAYLIWRSTFLPKFLAVLMAFAGLGWLMFLSPSFAMSLSPYIFLPGITGEGALTLWLVAFAVDEERWRERERATLQNR